jgi:hypothetical protein
MYNHIVYGGAAMTTNMVRKQIYIHKRQQNLLHQLARQRGTSEAEIIRLAIDRETTLQEIPPSEDSHSALEKILQAAYSPCNQLGVAGEPYRFNRSELYGERESRWIQEEKKD